MFDQLFPSRCLGCGARTAPVCPACTTTLRRAPSSPPPFGIDEWWSVFAYEGVAREAIARVKYRNQRHALNWLVAQTVELLRRVGAVPQFGEATPPVIVAVPTTARRRRERGFDHGELLARRLACGLGLDVSAALTRVDQSAQTLRSPQWRRSGPQLHAHVSPAWVLLIDDVTTSGASLRNAAAALRGAGAQRVCAVTLARTPARNQATELVRVSRVVK